jgi:outer membrane lipoprotein SlyB
MKKLIPVLALPLFLGSCAQQSLTGDSYSRSEAGTPQSVRTGKITSIRNVNLEGSSTGGTVLGAVAGGFLGRQVGSGSGQDAATVGGAVLGGVAGSHAGKAINNRPGLEITVRMDEGGSLSIVQQVNPRESFSVGERVRVLDNGARARVTH